jgi:hypothetical protein
MCFGNSFICLENKGIKGPASEKRTKTKLMLPVVKVVESLVF